MILQTSVISMWFTELLLSGAVVLIGFVLIALLRVAHRALVDRVNPILVDLVGSVALIGIVVVGGLAIADIWDKTDVLLDQLGFLRLDDRAPAVVITAVILVATQIFAGIIKRLLDDLTTESQALTEHQREVGVRVTQLTLWTIGIIVILGVWDVDLTGVLVGAGFLGIVLGLASRKTLGSLIAGLVLMFSRPFEVGDWIAIGDHEGWVTDITLMSTRVRGLDGTHIVVPNDSVNSEIVLNHSREGRIRAEVDVGVDYDTDIDEARTIASDVANEIAADHHATATLPEPDVVVRSFEDSSIVLRVRLWIEQPTPGELNDIRDALICGIKDAFEEASISIPYPQHQLSTRGNFQVTGGTRTDDRDEH